MSFDVNLMVSKIILILTLEITNALDYATTKIALEKGLKEANPLARALMKWGWRKYQLVKFLLPQPLVASALMSDEPYYSYRVAMAVGSLVFGYAVINNLMLIRSVEK